MIKLTLREAIAASKALQVLPKFPVKPSFNLSRIRIALQPEITAYIEQERALIEEYGGKVNEMNGITWPETKEGEQSAEIACTKARDEFLGHEIQIDREPVRLDALGESAEVAPEFFVVLEKIIVE